MLPHSNALGETLMTLVQERLNNLASRSFDQLTSLPIEASEELIVHGDKVSLSAWHDVLPSTEHRFVIQAYKPGLLGIGKMYADGFVLNVNNQRRILTVDEWAPFS